MAKSTNTKSGKTKKVLSESTHQTHAALPPRPKVNMFKLFGIDDGYGNTESVDEYRKKLEAMTITDLHDHSHSMGIVPLDARDKLIGSLVKKFNQAKAAQVPGRVFSTPMNPEMAAFHRKLCSDTLGY